MRYVAAYLLAGLGGNEKPSARDIENILRSVGVEVNKERLMHVIRELEGKNMEEIIAEGKEKLAEMKAVMTQPEVVPESSTAGTPDIKEENEEKKEETEESDDDLGFGLFD